MKRPPKDSSGNAANKPFHGPEKKLSKKLKRKEIRESLGKTKDAAERPKRTFKGGRAKGLPVPASAETPGDLRLNQFISRAGVCSRREADALIAEGLIKVNGKVVKELGIRVKHDDRVEYNGKTLQGERMVYVLLNKPKGYITTTEDDKDRRTVMELVASACEERIYPVGRLDRSTIGLLLFTNDGDLAKKLTHPASNVRKIYHVYLNKPMALEDLETIAQGVTLEDGLIKPDRINYVVEAEKGDEIGIQIHSGKNRIVRRIFEHMGYTVEKLDRTLFAGLTKKDLPRGKWRFLNDKEVAMLKMLGTGEVKAKKPAYEKPRPARAPRKPSASAKKK
jgi:23S rRNA pseudouridine2605 synthase